MPEQKDANTLPQGEKMYTLQGTRSSNWPVSLEEVEKVEAFQTWCRLGESWELLHKERDIGSPARRRDTRARMGQRRTSELLDKRVQSGKV